MAVDHNPHIHRIVHSVLKITETNEYITQVINLIPGLKKRHYKFDPGIKKNGIINLTYLLSPTKRLNRFNRLPL